MTAKELDDLFSTLAITQPIEKKFFYDPKATFTPRLGVVLYDLHPKNVIFNPPATIVEWEDGTKTVVKCHDDKFSEEFGYAMAVMRKIYGSRKNFMAQFKDAYRPYLKPKKTKNKAEDRFSDGVQS